MEKICFICSLEKPLEEFYKHKGMEDGHLNKCKICCREQNKERELKLREDPNWLNKEKDRAREKYYRLGYKDKHKPSYEDKKRHMLAYKERYPEKIYAHNVISNFSKKEGFNLHHWSYLEEHYKDVIELSTKDHYTAHRFIIYDQERMQYRTLDGILLDTKESHLEYISSKF